MPSSSLSAVVQHLRAAAGKDGGGRTDAELLTQFLNRRDEDALAALVERHAPMVWGVCRRVLHNPHDAEDAFQATFLVLVQKAATVVPRDMVANWLHGVAQQTAVRLRASAAKRGWREVQLDVMPEPAEAEARDEELLSWLDEELSRLPERFRALILLCDLEGRTRKEVARQLGCPEGTVASGLARARALLAKRLTRRGLAVSGGSLAAILSHSMASADVPASVVTSTINVATLLAAGKAAGVISGPVATLTQGVLKTMLLRNILSTTMAVLALGVAVITCGSLAVGQTDGKPAVGTDVKAPVAEKPVGPAANQEKEPFTAWGEEVGGLQAGIGFKAVEKRVYHHGETVTLVLRVRNVGKEEVKFEYLRQYHLETPPSVMDATGNQVAHRKTLVEGERHVPVQVTLAPGKETELTGSHPFYELKLDLTPAYGTGKVKIGYDQVFGNSSIGRITIDPGLEKLATGKLELEVTDDTTAWGKEVGGLQAGLGFKAGEKRVYTHGEKVTLVVRLRNVGKEPVTFGEGAIVWQLTNPISVTDSDGKVVYVQCLRPFGSFGQLGHRKTQLPPGKEVEYDQVTLQLKPAVAQEKQVPDNILFGSGKFRVEYRTDGFGSNNPVTGKLELEVKEPEKVPQDKNAAFIAWGKDVGGLQAGLGFKAGEKRVYRHGETVTLVVRVRNVGKEAVKFEYLYSFFVENPPVVTDDKDKLIPLRRMQASGKFDPPNKINLDPGKEIELYELKLELKPSVYATGKSSVQYERVLGNSSLGAITLDPALSKLATGKLELEVTEALPMKQKVLTPEDAIKIAGDSELTKKFNATKPAVEFKVEFVTKAIQIKASGEKDASWVHGHSPNDVCLGTVVAADDPQRKTRFVAILTEKAIKQLNKAGIDDLESHFKGKTVRVTGLLSRHDYRGYGAIPEVEIVLDDMSQLEVGK